MNVLIVDDERHAREELAGLLKHLPDVRVVGEAPNAPRAREQIALLKPDLVFLDIQMPEESGLELLNSLGQDAPRIIFTTAYDTYALRAFEFGAADYLLKPVVPKRLAVALRRVSVSSPGMVPDETPQTDGDAGMPPRSLRPDDKVLLGDAERMWYVPVHQIIGAESLGAHSLIWLAEATPVIRRSLAVLENRLPGDDFIRANRSQLINLRQVQAVEPWFSGGLKVTLTGGRSVELSRRQAKLFRERSTL
ncbi:DNA-binding response regulator [Opitutaceae bacterium EW11]|nr:DNA-binding response regulator [Opitutaceae bacterium EW11]